MITQKEQRLSDFEKKAQELSFFRFQYTHRHFYIDCKLGHVNRSAVEKALASIELCLLQNIICSDKDKCLFYIHEVIAHYHNEFSGSEEIYNSAIDSSDFHTLKIISDTCLAKKADVKLVHSIAFKYGYSPLLLLGDIDNGTKLLSFAKARNFTIPFSPPNWSFLQESKPSPFFIVRDLHKTRKYEDSKKNLFYAYLNIINPGLTPKKMRQEARLLSKDIIKLIDRNKCFQFGDEHSADFQICIKLFNIDRKLNRWKAKLENHLYLQILFYMNYIFSCPFSESEIKEVLYVIQGIPYEQAGPEIRLQGLALWDLVNDAVSKLEDKEKPYPPHLLQDAITEVQKIMKYRPADLRDRPYHRNYLLADLCINKMDLYSANQITDKISNHFYF